jgi:hypothetical protein
MKTDQATDTPPQQPAVGAPLDRGVRPRAWAIFVDNGNARMWSTLQPHVQKLADAEGLKVTPLYALPPDLADYLLCHLRQERAALDGFLRLGNEKGRAKRLDAWIACLAGPNVRGNAGTQA